MHMPPALALLFTLGFIFFLFRRDIREKPNVTGALWLPLFWMLIIFSRPFSKWLNILGLPVAGGATSMEEGSPLDACFYFILLSLGICVLFRRRIRFSEIVRNNGWLIVFFLYCFVAIFWSDFSLIAFKRWTKIIGHPVMTLILFSEPDFEEALTRLMKRCAYVVVPVSILFIKYYAHLGRHFTPWGAGENTGAALSKNVLGADCMILGFFFIWHLLEIWPAERSKARRDEMRLTAGFLLMLSYLFLKAHSMTSLGSLFIGALIMTFVGTRFVNKRFIGTYIVLAVATLAVADTSFGLLDQIVDLTGHRATIIGRAELWRELLGFHTNRIFGVGFESFWLGDRLQALWDAHWWHPTEAHNGYLEIYLSLGALGLLLVVGLFIATFHKIRLDLLRNFRWGRFRLGFLVAVVLYNWTEAAFKGLHPVWFVFYIIAVEYGGLERESVVQLSELRELDEEPERAYFKEYDSKSIQALER